MVVLPDGGDNKIEKAVKIRCQSRDRVGVGGDLQGLLGRTQFLHFGLKPKSANFPRSSFNSAQFSSTRVVHLPNITVFPSPQQRHPT
jgi:hypothetical protein